MGRSDAIGETLPGAMPASIYKSPSGRAEILRLYDEAATRLGVEHEDLTVETRFGGTHVLAIGPEDAPPVVLLPGGNFLNPTCLGWFLPLADAHRSSSGTHRLSLGPAYADWGLMMRSSAICSKQCAVHPAALATAKVGVNSSTGIPSPCSNSAV